MIILRRHSTGHCNWLQAATSGISAWFWDVPMTTCTCTQTAPNRLCTPIELIRRPVLHQEAQLAGNGDAMGAAGLVEFVARGTSPPKFAICASPPGGLLNPLLLLEDPSFGETAGRAVPHNGNWTCLANSCMSLHLWCRCVTCRREQQKNLARLCWRTVVAG